MSASVVPATDPVPALRVRLARDDEGPRIGVLAEQNGLVFDTFAIDWTRPISPYWLVATHEEEIVGALQVSLALPLARVEWLLLDPAASLRLRMAATLALVRDAAVQCARGGCQMLFAAISKERAEFHDLALANGWVAIDDATLVVKRLV